MARQAWKSPEGGEKVVYSWKLPGLYDISAQTAGEELSRIYQRDGSVNPSTVVDESRPETAPLHSCFEWRDDVAAEKYRETQAAQIIRSVVVVSDEGNKETAVRAYVHVENNYHPLDVVVESETKYDELLRSALADLVAYKNKYAMLSDNQRLRAVFSAIDQISA